MRWLAICDQPVERGLRRGRRRWTAAARSTPSRRVSTLSADQEGGGGVEQDDVAIGAGLAVQQARAGPRRSAAGVAAGEVGQRGARQADGLGRDGEQAHRAVAPFGDLGLARWWSSRPCPSPCTTQARSAPSAPSTWASGSTQRAAKTPTTWRWAPAGLVSGPSRLKMVRKPSSARIGETWRMAPWWAGANRKQMPASSSARALLLRRWRRC